MSLEEHILERLKEDLDVFATEYAVDENGEVKAIFEACDLLEEDLDGNWILYESFDVDNEGYPETVVEIEVFTDADESEFDQAEAVYEAGYPQ